MKALLVSILAVHTIGLSLVFHSNAAEDTSTMTASDLARRVRVLQEGTTYVRMRMEIKGATRETLQLQLKERRTDSSSEVVYQVLYPKERKGESVLLRKIGNQPVTGSVLVPSGNVRPIDDLKAPLLGSDLSYEDVIDNFFSWSQQAIVGNGDVNGVNCKILESKPGKGGSSYSSVRAWIDMRRFVPLRVEKYAASGKVLRRIETTRVVTDEGYHIPADLTVSGARADSSTLLNGSRIKHNVVYSDRDFTVDGLKEITTPDKP
jgi:hypothetical protein